MPPLRRASALAWGIVLVLGLVGSSVSPTAQGAPQAGSTIYLPLVSRNYSAFRRVVNTPYLNVPDVVATKFSEMAVFWYGAVDNTNNYTDVRVGYNDSALYVYTAAFDRRLWYNTSPQTSDIIQWDSASLYLDVSGGATAPTNTVFRFDAQLTNGGGLGANSKATYRGNGSGWQSAAINFTGNAGWRGTTINDATDDKGWVMTFQIPFASVGLAGRPADGSRWQIAVVTHDRDDAGGTPIADSFWPETFNASAPSTWGQLRFGGLPAYVAPPASGGSTATIRQGLNGATVTDAQVGGGTVCGGAAAPTYFPTWGSLNYNASTDGPIQNQSDISDWPCFSKYYVTFPLTSLPVGKAIISATLTLHQKGNSGAASNGDQPGPSLIQVLVTEKDWSEASITWNNAPWAWENVSQAWVDPLTDTCDHIPPIAWPCVPRQWDVSRAVALAYASNQPLRLVLYSADSAYSTGKYFISSDSFQGIWPLEVLVGRPTLSVRWGNP